jgi:hypothetical protein
VGAPRQRGRWNPDAGLQARAVSDHRESVLIWIPKMLRMSESVRDNRFAGTGCLAPILLIYESVLSAR